MTSTSAWPVVSCRPWGGRAHRTHCAAPRHRQSLRLTSPILAPRPTILGRDAPVSPPCRYYAGTGRDYALEGETTVATKMGPKQATAEHALDLSMLPEKRDYRRIDAFAREYLTVPKGTGALTPFRLRPWQRSIVKAMYPPTGKRPRQGLV